MIFESVFNFLTQYKNLFFQHPTINTYYIVKDTAFITDKQI